MSPLPHLGDSSSRHRAIEAACLTASRPIEGCDTGMGGCGGTHTDCYYGAIVDAVLSEVRDALEQGYHAQNPSQMHPADYLTKKFELEGHEGLIWR